MTVTFQVDKLSKHFSKDGEDLVALRNVDLTVQKGSFLALLGRSGCGKSTLLNLLAGLTTPTTGEIHYQGEKLSGRAPMSGTSPTGHADALARRAAQRGDAAGTARRVEGSAASCRANPGGTGRTQRIREELPPRTVRRDASAGEPGQDAVRRSRKRLLLDEPFSALDAQLRTELQTELLRLWSGSGRTVVFVTHDIEEALLLADRVIVLGQLGRIVLDQEVDLPRPRDPDDIRVAPHFVELHRRLSAALKEGAQ